MRPPAIPQSHWAEVQRLSREGKNPQEIVDWLAGEDVTCSHMAVRRLLERLGNPGRIDPQTLQAPPPLVEALPPAPPPPPVQPASMEEGLEVIRIEAYREIRAGESEDDWKRKHSAMRLAIQADRAIDEKRRMDLELGDGAGGRALTSDEEAAALEAARQALVTTYELQDPSTLPAPGPGAPLTDDGRPAPN